MKNTLITLYFILFLFACSDKIDDSHDHPDLTTGKQFFNLHCASCHRESGMGRVMDGIPPVLYSKLTHSQMRKMIITGHEGANMPQYTNMPKAEARKITRYIDQLKKLKNNQR